MDFYDLDLNDAVLDALDDMRFTETTPIQEHSIPPILAGRDLIGVAQTGTGKTAAYLLPILSMLSDGGYPDDVINCVIMSPTRELAQQIDQAMQGFSYYLTGISSVAVYGGNDGIRYEQEKRGFDSGASIIIATPGRLISHISLGNIDLSHVSFFILDEADRMLDMGFYDDIMQIERQLPRERQTIMFSATMPDRIVELAKNILHNPVQVRLAVSRPADGIHQSAIICHEAQKLKVIKALFQDIKPHRVIIFAGSKLKVKDLNITLVRAGVSVAAMHSDLSQAERDQVMYKFKSGQVAVLVATDIVARGIDIDDVQMVINFDVPRDAEDYVHRVGRTARAGAEGTALTLVSDKDYPDFRKIEKFLGSEIEKRPLPDGVGEPPKVGRQAERRSHRPRRGTDRRQRSRGRHSIDAKKTDGTTRSHRRPRGDRPKREGKKTDK
ncbi:MAG: DEAD/DEAH box helicase [Prevotellaceae bacterium]|nr:DEAD/DEAH box helicase [Prevotellaceae bacterium]